MFEQKRLWVDTLDEDLPKRVLSPTLYEKFLESVKIIEDSFSTSEKTNVALSFNGGKENIILLHITRYVLSRNKKNIILFNFEEYTFPEIEKFVVETISRFNLDVIHLKEKGYKACFFKLLDNYPEISHVLMGVRRTDPFCENAKFYEPTTDGWPKCIRVNPIINWTYEEVWKFTRALELPFCQLYAQGYTSIGSIETTKPNPELLDGDKYLPAWELKDESLERKGRSK